MTSKCVHVPSVDRPCHKVTVTMRIPRMATKKSKKKQTKMSVTAGKFPYKLVAIDLDGTLLCSNKKVSQKNIETLRRLHNEHDVKVVLASGRMAELILPIYKEDLCLDDCFTIGYNGGKCLHLRNGDHSTLFHNSLPKDTFHTLFNYASDNNLCLALYTDGKCYGVKNEKYHERMVLFGQITSNTWEELYESYDQFHSFDFTNALFLCDNEAHADQLFIHLRAIFPKDQIHVVKTECATKDHHQFYVEILHAEANKGKALEQLCAQINIDPQHVVVFGDGENDIEMFQFAGLGICMANGVPKLKEVAHKVSNFSNNEDGVHRELEDILLASAQ